MLYSIAQYLQADRKCYYKPLIDQREKTIMIRYNNIHSHTNNQFSRNIASLSSGSDSVYHGHAFNISRSRCDK